VGLLGGATCAKIGLETTSQVSGVSLSERLVRGRLALADSVSTAIQIAVALHQIHSGGASHGAVTPERVVLTETGIEFLPAPNLNALSVTPYTSPERLDGLPPSDRSDIFAFGAVLFEMLTGQPPFRGVNAAELHDAILTGDPEPVSSLMAEVPVSCGRLLDRL